MDKLLTGRRVLVIEDEMLVVMMIEDMLADLGCEHIVTAATVDQAVALVEGQRFDAAMLDMNLDGSDSQLVADALARHGVPFAYSTGNAGHDSGNDFQGRPVLKKPFGEADLAAMLKTLLAE